MEHGPFGVDTPEDLERARKLLLQRSARTDEPSR
jgi:CMP-2-keto-3-deoxyoctulosonic acid synthetase